MAKSKYEKILEPNLEVISGMAKKGVSEKDIANHFKIAYSTFRKYKDEHKELKKALIYGTEEANAVMSGTLFEAGHGFYRTVIRPMKVKRTEFDPEKGRKIKEWEEIVDVEEIQYFPPNLGAIALWLTNHDSENYSKNPKTEAKSDGGGVVMLAEIEEN